MTNDNFPLTQLADRMYIDTLNTVSQYPITSEDLKAAAQKLALLADRIQQLID